MNLEVRNIDIKDAVFADTEKIENGILYINKNSLISLVKEDKRVKDVEFDPYSFDLSADWKGFDIRGFFQGIGKRDWYAGGGNHYFWGIYAQPWTNVQTHNLDHWTPENPNAYYPRVKPYIAESTGSELACVQTTYMQDAS